LKIKKYAVTAKKIVSDAVYLPAERTILSPYFGHGFAERIGSGYCFIQYLITFYCSAKT